jgi:hypothetical protein
MRLPVRMRWRSRAKLPGTDPTGATVAFCPSDLTARDRCASGRLARDWPRRERFKGSGVFGAIVAVGVLVALVGLASCASARARQATPPSRIVPSSTVPATTSTTDEALTRAAILSQWRAFEATYVANDKDPQGASQYLLANVAAGNELAYLQQFFAAHRRDGLVARGDVDLNTPRVDSIDGPTATVVDCVTDHLQLIVAATGQPAQGSSGNPGPTPVGTRATLLAAPSGMWMVSDVRAQEGTCAGYE